MFINLTQSAEDKFKEQLEQRGKGIGILIGVKQTGCSGYAYTLEFVDIPVSGFHKHFKNFTLFVNPDAENMLDGVTIDYIKQGMNEKFEFINPREKDRCGCGESFRV